MEGTESKHSVWPISDRVPCVSFWQRWSIPGASRMFLRWGSCQQAPGSSPPPSGFNGQHSPAVNMDWRETYTKNNITEKQNKSIFLRSREHIFAFQLCDRLGFTLARPRLLKSTDRKENELWIVLCPIVNLPKSKWGNRGFFLCLTTAWQHPKCEMESPGAPQRFPNRGMGEEKQGSRLPVQQLVSEGPSPALRKPLDI